MMIMQKTRILFVIPSFNTGGTVSSLVSIINSQFSSLYDIDVFSIKKSGSNETLSFYDIGLNDAISAVHCGFSSLTKKERIKFSLLKILLRIPFIGSFINRHVEKMTIRRIEKKNNYDYVVAFQEDYTTRFVKNFHCEKKIAWVHCDYAYAIDKSKSELELYSDYYRIVCVSNYTRKEFVNRYPSLGNRTIAIHNLFDASIIKEKSAITIEDSQFESSAFSILSVGRISAVKQFSLIPSIAADLLSRNLLFKWYIIGNANYQDELQKLNNEIEKYGVQDCVLYLGGKNNPYPYFVKSDLLVCLSKSEACPMVFNEAKVLRLPILSTDFGSSYEFIEEGKNGFITSIEQIPVKLEELIINKESLYNMKKASLADADDSNGIILSQLRQLFE